MADIGDGGAILVPVAVLTLLAAVLPRVIARVTGRGVKAGAVNLALSSAVLTLISGGYFAVLYVLSDARVMGAMGATPLAALGHFLWLGLMAGLVWAPVAVVSLSALSPDGGR